MDPLAEHDPEPLGWHAILGVAQSSRRQTGCRELVLDRLAFIRDATEDPHR
jgi:hypothetical protein